MDVVVLGAEEVGVVVADQWQREFPGQLLEERIDPLLLRDMALQLDIEARVALLVGAEGLGVPASLGQRRLPVLLVGGAGVELEVVGDRASEMPVDCDQAVAPLGKRRLVHARLVVEAVDIGVGAELEEIAPALIVLGEQHQMESAVGDSRRRSIATVSGRDIRLDAEDRLDPGVLRGADKLHRAVQIAVVGDRDGGHPQLLHAGDQRLETIAAIEERVLAVKMEMHEAARRGVRHEARLRGPRGSWRGLGCGHGVARCESGA